MRRIATVLCLCVLLTGCTKPNYSGTCTIQKADGKVTVVTIEMPTPANSERNRFRVQNREEMDKIISGLESMVLDLKAARDQMPVNEPAPPK